MELTQELEHPAVYFFVGSRLGANKGYVEHGIYDELLAAYRKLLKEYAWQANGARDYSRASREERINQFGRNHENQVKMNLLKAVYPEREQHAISQGKVQGSSIEEHQDRDQGGSTTEAGHSDCTIKDREIKQEVDVGKLNPVFAGIYKRYFRSL